MWILGIELLAWEWRNPLHPGDLQRSSGPAECGLGQAWGLNGFTLLGGVTVGGVGAEEGALPASHFCA